MSTLPSGFPDPRPAREDAPAAAAPWYRLAERLLASPGGADADRMSAALEEALGQALESAPADVQRAIDAAPSPPLARQLWRTTDTAFARKPDLAANAVDITPFAIPVVVLAGRTAPGTAQVTGLLRDPRGIARTLVESRALGGSETVAVSEVLVAPDALAIANLPAWRALQRLPDDASQLRGNALFLAAPIAVEPGPERVHLRFVVGTALAGAGRDLFRGAGVVGWGRRLSAALGEALATDGTTVLALPREAGRPLPARHQGLLAQRDVGAQVFATNAIRKFRASVGEPAAVISAHHAPDAPGGGELRLSLSSVFAPRDAEGFRCPIYPIESVSVPLRMLLDLLNDCRVSDVRLVAGVHPANAPGSAMPLFFRPETIPEGALLQ